MSYCNSCYKTDRKYKCLVCNKKICKDCVVNLICKNCLSLYLEKQLDTNDVSLSMRG